MNRTIINVNVLQTDRLHSSMDMCHQRKTRQLNMNADGIFSLLVFTLSEETTYYDAILLFSVH